MRYAFLFAAMLAVTSACTDSPIQPEEVGPLFSKVVGPAHITGTTGPGSQYELFLPAEWNGDLLLYAHGYTNPAAPIALPAVYGLRNAALALGYGVAWSSYSENGWAVKDGVTRTRQLRGLFTSKFGKPGRTYLMGHSLGAIVTLMAAEKNPTLYDGAMPICGLVGGAPLEIDYVFNVRVLFDHYFPGVIPGDALQPPGGLDFAADVVPLVVAAVSGNPSAALEMAGVAQIDLPSDNFPQVLNSIISALFFAVTGAQDLLDRTGGIFFDNAATVYTGSSDDDALNAGVERFTATPSARNYLEHQYLPQGNLKIPVLTLHTTKDPGVPFFHESAFASIVSSAGASDLLVQRSFDRFGHCAISGQEHVAAFLDLVNWVENQVVPTP